MFKYLDETQAEKFVRDKHPESQDISVITHGYDNIVIVVDKNLVYRFSRTDESAASEQIEQKILSALGGLETVRTPIILGESDVPAYICLSYLAGEHRTIEDFRTFTDDEKDAYVIDLIAFMTEMQQKIPDALLAEIAHQRADTHDTWYNVLRTHLKEAAFPDSPQLQATAREYWDRWLKLCHRTTLPKILVHDDLHADNLLFLGHKLHGVLDFADAGVGSAAQELRHMYWVDEDMVQRTIIYYEKMHGMRIEPDEIVTWAIATELASYHEHMSEKEHPSFIRTRNNLRKWLPGINL